MVTVQMIVLADLTKTDLTEPEPVVMVGLELEGTEKVLVKSVGRQLNVGSVH